MIDFHVIRWTLYIEDKPRHRTPAALGAGYFYHPPHLRVLFTLT
jgi:hypothetical protein